MSDTRSLYGMIFSDLCIMKGCVHEYGHEGKHEYEGAPATSAPVLTTACGQYRVQDCLCGDCESLDTPESFANQVQRAQGAGRPEQDRDAIAFGYTTWRA